MTPYDFSLLYQPPDIKVGLEEGTQEWLDARRGRITASDRAHKILYSHDKTLDTMMDQMGEELKHPAGSNFTSAATDHGHAFESQAVDEYDMARLTFGEIIKSPGLFVHPSWDIASATPDFFVGDDVSGQIKCPYKLKNHLNLLHFGCRKVSARYYTQVQFEAYVTGRDKIVFVSYHPDARHTNQLHIEEIEVCQKTQDKFHQKLSLINHMLVNSERFVEKESAETLDGGIPDLF